EFHYRLGRDLLEKFPGCDEHSVVARAAKCGVQIYTSSPGDSSIGMNIAWHELMNGSRLMIDPNLDVNEVCAIILGERRTAALSSAEARRRTSICRASPRCGRCTAFRRAATSFSSKSRPIRWSGGACPARRRR